MKADDELKEWLGGMFHDFESDPHPQAWERIEKALSHKPSGSMWPKIVTGALIGVFCASVCHAPVHSQLAQWKATHKASQSSSAAFSKASLVPKYAADVDKKYAKTVNREELRRFSEFVKQSIPVNRAINKQHENQMTLIEAQNELLKVRQEEIMPSFPTNELNLRAPELLDKHSLKELPFAATPAEVKPPRLASKRSNFIKLWSVSVMPLATYQRMYVMPEASEQIRQIQAQQSLNPNRTGIRLGTDLTLLRQRSAWRFGLNYTQMRRQTEYTLVKNAYTLTTTANLSQPTVSQQTEQVEETAQWQLLGLRADRQYQLASIGRQRYFVSVGTEGAVELSGRQPYVWGHVSVGMQQLLTPRIWMSVEPTASYSLLSQTAANGLLRINPYNFGIKVSIGILP